MWDAGSNLSGFIGIDIFGVFGPHVPFEDKHPFALVGANGATVLLRSAAVVLDVVISGTFRDVRLSTLVTRIYSYKRIASLDVTQVT